MSTARANQMPRDLGVDNEQTERRVWPAQSEPEADPRLASEVEERRFWETHDSAAYVDWSSAGFVRFPNLKPSTETISLRLPAGFLADLKALANKQDVPYQSLLKVFLADRVTREWQAIGPQGPQV